MDVDEATLNLVKEGVIDATVGQKPFTMAYYGLKQIVELHENPLKQLDKDYETDSFSPVPAFVDTGARWWTRTTWISFCVPGRTRRSRVASVTAKQETCLRGRSLAFHSLTHPLYLD